MWTKSENGEPIRPEAVETCGNNVILRRNVQRVEATEEIPEHYVWEEWQMTKEQYEIHQYHEQIEKEQADALVELAELIVEGTE